MIVAVDENYDRRKLTQAALEMWHQIQPDLCANYEKLTMQDVDLKRFEKLNLETHQFLMLQHWQSFLDKNLKILFTPVTEDTEKIVAEVSRFFLCFSWIILTALYLEIFWSYQLLQFLFWCFFCFQCAYQVRYYLFWSRFCEL